MHKTIKATLLALVTTLLLAIPAIAYLYYIPIAIIESSSTAYPMLPVVWTANNTWMASNSFIKATALDTRVQTLGGTAQPHLVADNKTLTAVPVEANSSQNLRFTTGNSDLTSMAVIVGVGGYVTTTDHASLEPGATAFEMEWQGYYDSTRTGEILCKDSYCIDSSVAGTIRAYVLTGASVQTTLTAVTTSGIRKVKFTKDAGTNLELLTATCTSETVCAAYVSQDTDNSNDAIVVNTANNFTSSKNGPVAYTNFSKITINGVLVLHYAPITIISGSALPDRSASANNGVITWGSNPLGVSVTVSSLVASSQPPVSVPTLSPRDVLPVVGTSDWYSDNTVGGTASTNPLSPIVSSAAEIWNAFGTTQVNEIQLWRLFGFIVFMGIVVPVAFTVRHHQFLTGVVACALLIGMVIWNSDIFPGWLVAVAVSCLVAGLVAERSPVL